MKHKRLNRDGWGFQYYPYYQMRIDCECFHGLACLIRFTDGEANYWETPKAGRIQVTGEGMTWLELIPDNAKRVITVKYFPDNTHDEERVNYPKDFCAKYRPSIWYVDIIEGIEYDEDGIAFFIDKYLDVIFTPEGDIKIDDRDELDAAHDKGELSDEQYTDALTECDHILNDLCSDIAKTNSWCAEVRDIVEKRIAEGESITRCREVWELAKTQEVVESKRLKMRRLIPEDYKVMAAWDMDERVYKYLLGSACKTPEEPLVWLPQKDPTSKVNILMLVSEKEDGHAVGIYALNHDVERDVWSLSYVNRYDDWGKGYTVEGMSALMEHAVKVYGAHTFEGECAKENIGSRKVMEKLGMVYDHSSSYTKNDGSATFESDIYTLTIGET